MDLRDLVAATARIANSGPVPGLTYESISVDAHGEVSVCVGEEKLTVPQWWERNGWDESARFSSRGNWAPVPLSLEEWRRLVEDEGVVFHGSDAGGVCDLEFPTFAAAQEWVRGAARRVLGFSLESRAVWSMPMSPGDPVVLHVALRR